MDEEYGYGMYGGNWGGNYDESYAYDYDHFIHDDRMQRTSPWDGYGGSHGSQFGDMMDSYGYDMQDRGYGRRVSVYERLSPRSPMEGRSRANNASRYNWALAEDLKKFPIITNTKPRFKAKGKPKINQEAVKKAFTSVRVEGEARKTPEEKGEKANVDNKSSESQDVKKDLMESQTSESAVAKNVTGEAENIHSESAMVKDGTGEAENFHSESAVAKDGTGEAENFHSESAVAKDGTGEAEMSNDVPKQNEDGDNQEKSSDGKKEKAVKVESLWCHFCDEKNFETIDDFKEHLRDNDHNSLARVYLEKVYSMLDLLKAQSRVQSQQNIVKMQKKKGSISMCSQCECPIKGGIYIHRRFRIHELVNSFTRCKLCKEQFNTRGSLEKHFLSFNHLRRTYNLWLHDKDGALKLRNKDYGFPELMEKLHDAVHEMRLSRRKILVWNLSQVDTYDPSCLYGLNRMERIPHFYCTICPKKYMVSARDAKSHYSSEEHYNNYVAYLASKNAEDNDDANSNGEKVSETVAIKQDMKTESSCEDESFKQSADAIIKSDASYMNESNPDTTGEETVNGDENIVPQVEDDDDVTNAEEECIDVAMDVGEDVQI